MVSDTRDNPLPDTIYIFLAEFRVAEVILRINEDNFGLAAEAY